MAPPTAKTRVRERLTEAEDPLDQEELIETLQSSGEELEREDILRALRVLMDQDEVSYSIDWNLQLEQ
jgi:hypothetical protein